MGIKKKVFGLIIKKFPFLLPFITLLLSIYFRVLLLPAKEGYIIQTRQFKFKCPLEAGFNSVYVFKEVFSGIYERFTNKADLIVDCGAHIGFFTIKMTKMRRKVIAIEPHPTNLLFLKENIRKNEVKNVTVVEKAVGDKKGKAEFFFGNSFDTGSLRFPSKSSIEVEVDTLDSICKELNVSGIDLLKIDVEGAELDVLKGAEESLKFTKNIAMELHYEGEDEEIRRFLEERGFTVKIVGNMLYASKQ